MLIEQELTAAQLVDAYQGGQREFIGIEVIGEGNYPSLQNTDLSAAEFSDCWFHSATFSNVNFKQVKFTRCNLKCTTFESCNFVESNWSDCPVCSISISNCDTSGMVIGSLNAYGAEIESVTVFLEYAAENLNKRKSQ